MRIIPLALAGLIAFNTSASAFCGFYVATSDDPLVNKASRVVLVRDEARTVVTMASDVHGDPKQFALVIPVPTVIRREQVRIVKPETVEHLADHGKPRLVQYFDNDPCPDPRRSPPLPAPMAMAAPMAGMAMDAARSRVRVEAAFSVEEYDIMVLSADDSDGLITWLNRNGYKMPNEAGPVVASYLRQHMHFFVAKVNLDRMKNNRSGFLRPIRVEYDTPKFMLPIRLGTVNASGPQDMIVIALSRRGRVDVTNYRTVRMPTGENVPEYVQEKFGAFYDALFERQFAESGGDAAFLEYAWPVSIATPLCDPCVGPTLQPGELEEVGAAWTDQPAIGRGRMPATAFMTRLHVRYDRAHFPEDLQFQETPDTATFQARYVTQVAVKTRNVMGCNAGLSYLDTVHDRQRKEKATLARLTGWKPEEIQAAMVEHWNRTREN